MKKVKLFILAALITSAMFISCSTSESVKSEKGPDRPMEAPEGKASDKYEGLKRTVAIGRFSNETSYAKGAFYDRENDPMKKQVMDILSTKLTISGKFILLERSDLELVEKEQALAGITSESIGADYLLIGSITKYGRKTTGTHASIFGGSKTQTVEAGVSVRLIDVRTGEVIYAEEGNGEAEVTNASVLGFGTTANYDSTLSDKAIEAAVESLVGNIEKNCTDRPWKTYIISNEDNTVLISGGASQGIKNGDVFKLMTVGKKVKNPQTGLYITLPGDEVGKVQVVRTMGSGKNEYSIVNVISGSISGDISKYEIQE